MAHSVRARRALAHLPELDPGLAALALWCTHRDHVGPTQTKGETIFYGDGFTDLALHEQVGLLGHHVLHVALRHSWRMGAMALRHGDGFDPAVFNTVADALVNDTLLAAGHGLPRPCVTLADVLGETTPLAEWDVERLYHAARRQNGKGQGRQPQVQRDLEPNSDGDRADSGADEWRDRLHRAMAIGRTAGRGIGSTTAPLGDLPASSVPWERQLRRLVARHLEDTPRPSHQRPARTWIAADSVARAQGRPTPAFQPAFLRPMARPLIVVGLDTSGSVEPEVLKRFGGEIAGLTRRTGADVHLLAFDECVHLSLRLGQDRIAQQLADIDVRREGGTAFEDVFCVAATLSPSVIVILTDLDGPLGVSPREPVVWACPAAPKQPPSFGRVLVIE